MPKPRTRGNGQGTAYKRGQTWQARVVIGWKITGDPPHTVPIWRTKDGFKTKKDALAYCEVLKRETEKPKQAPLLETYWIGYSSGLMQTLSSSKQTAYTIAWGKLAAIHHKRIDSLTVAELQQLVNEKAPSFYTARDCKSLLQHLFKLAGAEGWVSKDVPTFIVLPKLEEKERQPFSDIEQAALWKLYESGDRRAAIPLLMISCGMMPGEAFRLKVENIDLEKRQITGVGMKTKVRKKTPIMLPNSILPVLEDLIANAQPSGYIWKRVESDWYADYYAALEAAGCRRLTPYSCRHSVATRLAVNENIAPQIIKRVMRWSTARMLDRYAHPDDKDALAAIETL